MRLSQSINIVLELAGIQAGSPVEPESIAVDFVATGARNHGDLGSTVASSLGGVVAGLYADLSQHVGVHSERGGFRAALACIIHVNSVKSIIPGAVTSAVYVAPTASIGAANYSGLHEDKVDRIAAATADNGQIHKSFLGNQVAVVA